MRMHSLQSVGVGSDSQSCASVEVGASRPPDPKAFQPILRNFLACCVKSTLAMGAGLAAATLAVIAPLSGAQQLVALAILLGLAGGVYPGFASADGTSRGVATEWIVALAFAALALAGVVLGPLVLAAGWTLHALWDVGHHHGRLGARAPRDYPWLCLAYDLVIAGYLVWGGEAAFPVI